MFQKICILTEIEIKQDFDQASELLAQKLTRVTGVEPNQTNNGLKVILQTTCCGSILVSLILPQGDLDNSFQLQSYTRSDAAIFYERGKFKTALNFRNLFDINYFEAADDNLEVYPGDPFMVVGSVAVEF